MIEAIFAILFIIILITAIGLLLKAFISVWWFLVILLGLILLIRLLNYLTKWKSNTKKLEESENTRKSLQFKFNKLKSELDSTTTEKERLKNQHGQKLKELRDKLIPQIKDLQIKNERLEAELNLLKKSSVQKSNSRQNPFSYIEPIPTRRPFNKLSFQIEKSIALILSNKPDIDGSILINLVIRMLEIMGYSAKNNDGYDDEKKDILVYRQNENKPFMVIQCKSYSPQTNHSRISKEDLFGFNGSVADNYPKGQRVYITSSYFEKTAIERFNQDIILIDRIGLIQLLLDYFPKETVNVLNSNTLHDINMTCKKCGHGKLQYIEYKKNSIYMCTNCNYKYDKEKDRYIPISYNI